MAQSNSSPPPTSVHSIVRRIENGSFQNDYPGEDDTRIRIEQTHTEIKLTHVEAPPRWPWDVSSWPTAHITSDPAKFRNDTSCEDSTSLPDVGIMRISYPDSVADLHPRIINKDDGTVITEAGVTKYVLTNVLSTISNDGDPAEQKVDSNLDKQNPNNLMQNMQWTLNAPLKINPPPALKDTRLETSTDSSQSDDKDTFSTTVPPVSNVSGSSDPTDDPMGHHVTKCCPETVLVELWYTNNKHNEAFSSPACQLKYIQQQVTSYVFEKLLCNDTKKYRVFVVPTEITSF